MINKVNAILLCKWIFANQNADVGIANLCNLHSI